MTFGYAHTVFVVVSEGLKVTVPNRVFLYCLGRTAQRWDILCRVLECRGNPNCIRASFFLSPLDFGQLLTYFAQYAFIGDKKIKLESGKKQLSLDCRTCLRYPVRCAVYGESTFRA